MGDQWRKPRANQYCVIFLRARPDVGSSRMTGYGWDLTKRVIDQSLKHERRRWVGRSMDQGRTPSSSRLNSSSAASRYTRYAPAASSSSMPYPPLRTPTLNI